MTRIIAVANQKGGVGKTTTVANLGAALAAAGQQVLLVDLDPQANLTVHLDLDPRRIERSVYDLLLKEAEAVPIIHPTAWERLSLLPAHLDLCGAEIELVSALGRETLLRDRLAPVIDRYDFILLDCPPSLGLLSLNAFTLARELLIPLQTQFFALQGMTKLLEVVRLVQSRLHPALRLGGILATQYDARTNLSREVLEEIRKHFPGQVFATVIRANIKLSEAPSHGRTILAYAPASPGAEDYRRLAEEVMRGIGAPTAALPATGEPDSASPS